MCFWNFCHHDPQKNSYGHAQSQLVMHLKVIISWDPYRSLHILNHFRPLLTKFIFEHFDSGENSLSCGSTSFTFSILRLLGSKPNSLGVGMVQHKSNVATMIFQMIVLAVEHNHDKTLICQGIMIALGFISKSGPQVKWSVVANQCVLITHPCPYQKCWGLLLSDWSCLCIISNTYRYKHIYILYIYIYILNTYMSYNCMYTESIDTYWIWG